MREMNPVLQKCPLFEGIRPEDLSGMLGCLGARPLEVKKGEPVFREGDRASFVGIVLSGAVQLIREDFYGNRSILAHIGPAQLFGESYAFSGAETLPVSVIADEDSRILASSSTIFIP